MKKWAAIDPQGHILLTASNKSALRRYDSKEGHLVREVTHLDYPKRYSYDPAQELFVLKSVDTTLALLLLKEERHKLMAATDWVDMAHAQGRLSLDTYTLYADYRQAVYTFPNTVNLNTFTNVAECNWPISPS